MRKLTTSLLSALLVPAVALADVSSTAQTAADSQPKPGDTKAQQASASTPPAAAAPAATATAKAAPAKKDDKKAGGLANAVQARTPEEQANQSGFQVNVSLDHWLGAGTFIDPALYSYLAANLTVQGIYLFGLAGKRFAASVTGRAAFEYTLPDAPNARRFEPFDTRLAVAAPALFRTPKFGPFSGLALTPSLSLLLPTSYVSLANGMIATVGAGLAATTRVKMFDLRVNVAGSRSFNSQTVLGTRVATSGTGRLATDANGLVSTIGRPGENFAAIIGNNTAWSASVGGSVQFRATDSLMLYAGYTYIYAWRYDVNATNQPDELTPRALDSNGNPVAENGLGRFDRTSAFVGGSYQFNDHYSFDLGVSTLQLPLVNAGGQWVARFPFLSIGSWADNTTTVYATLTAAY